MSTKKTPNAFFYLLIAIMLLTLAYAYKTKNDYTKLENAFKEEQLAVQNEFNELIDDYKDLSVKKKDLSKRLIKEINKIIALKDSVKNLKTTNFSLIRKYRRKVSSLERQNRTLFAQVDSLKILNLALKQESLASTVALSENKEKSKELTAKNTSLEKVNKELKSKVALAGIIKTSPIQAVAMKERSSGKLTSTSRSSRTDAFKVSFNLLENKFTKPGNKKVHVQIVDENRKVVAAQGTAPLKNGKVVYSQELVADYRNGELNVLSLVLVNRDDIEGGKYTVNAYVDGNFAGTTALKLK